MKTIKMELYFILIKLKNGIIFLLKYFLEIKIFKGFSICYLEYELNMIHAPYEYKIIFIETFIEDNKKNMMNLLIRIIILFLFVI